MPFASGEPFDISQAKVITRAKFGDSKPGNDIVSRMLLFFIYNISCCCGLIDLDDGNANDDSSELFKCNT